MYIIYKLFIIDMASYQNFKPYRIVEVKISLNILESMEISLGYDLFSKTLPRLID